MDFMMNFGMEKNKKASKSYDLEAFADY